MSQDFRISKVEILIQQNKFAEAEKMLGNLLTEEPNNMYYLALFAEVNLQQNKFDAAKSVIENAIGMWPDSAYLFYIKSRIAIQQDDLTSAEKDINEAIALDPYDADYYALLANIKLARKQFEQALQTADMALEIDAENLLALNTRSAALIKLNRSEESFQTIEGALREDPNNAYTHANYGWGLLEQGNHKKALQHFKEALTNNPNSTHAQVGMLEALKASNPVYKLFLKYAFWMSNLTARYQWGVIIGFYIGYNALRTIARNNEGLQPYLTPLIILMAVVAFSTWVINPISNLFLRFNPYGQLLLDKKEKLSSTLVTVSLAICLAALLAYFITSNEKMLLVAGFGFAMMVPLSKLFSSAKNEKVLLAYTIVLGIVGAIAIFIAFTSGEVFNTLTGIFLLGFMAFQWVANYLSIKEG